MLVYNANKAGMDGVDKDKVSKIIAENTSANFSHFTAKQQKRIDIRVEEIKRTLSSLTESDLSRAQKETDAYIACLESSRDLTRHCVHIDMDAFFAAVEMRDEPRLREVPMAVGSASMLSTSNYLARKCGVRAAMPGFIAKKLCPELEIVPGNYRKYSTESKVFSAIFSEYDQDMSMGSLDESYLDITEYLEQRCETKKFVRKRYGGCICRLPLISSIDINENLRQTTEQCEKCCNERIIYEDDVEFGCDRAEVVREIRFRVEQATGLTCSAGIAANFMLAKICSDLNKPNGQYELANTYDAIMDFLKNLPIRKVCGIGRVSEAHLKACEMETVGHILERRACLKFVFTPLSQESFLRVALGLPGRSREGDPRRKSVSVERTFSPTADEIELREYVKAICEELIRDIVKIGIKGGRCVTVKIKLSSFDVLTRSVTLSNLVANIDDLTSSAVGILTKEFGKEMRLLGVRLSRLQFTEEELTSRKTVLDFFNKPKKPKIDEEADDPLTTPGPSGTSSDFLSTDMTEEQPTTSDAIDKEDRFVECPLCSISLQLDDRLVNTHIDECLNSELIGKKKPPTKERKSTKRTASLITSFFR